jgi:hypothetical protein
MDIVALIGDPSESPAEEAWSCVPVKLPAEILATPERSGTVLSPGSFIPKKKFPERDVSLYVEAGCVSNTPPLALVSVLIQSAEMLSTGFVR